MSEQLEEMTSQEIRQLKDIVLKQIVNLEASIQDLTISEDALRVYIEFNHNGNPFKIVMTNLEVVKLIYLAKDYNYTIVQTTKDLRERGVLFMLESMQPKVIQINRLKETLDSLYELREDQKAKLKETEQKINAVSTLIERL